VTLGKNIAIPEDVQREGGLLGPDALLERLREVVQRSPAERTEAVYIGGRSDLTRYAASAVTQNVSEVNAQLWVRVANGRRLGVASVHASDREAWADAVQRAHELSRKQPENPHFDDFAPRAAYERVETFFETTARTTPLERAEALRRAFQAAERTGRELSGTFQTSVGEVAVVNSNGVEAYQPLTGAYLKVVALPKGASADAVAGLAMADGFARDFTQLDVEKIAHRAMETSARCEDVKEIPVGAYDVILKPPCVAEVLQWLSFIAFGSRAFLEGSSFLAGKLGQKLLGENVTLYDSFREPEIGSLPFDFEGTPKRKLLLIERGIARGVAFDRLDAHEAGTESTGHAGPPGSGFGALPWFLCMEPGDASLDEMIEGCERGLLIERFHYLNGFLDPPQAVMTGMTRYGTFYIEDGKIKHAVPNLRWLDSMVRAFSQIQRVGREREACVEGASGTFYQLVPALYIQGWQFTGQTG